MTGERTRHATLPRNKTNIEKRAAGRWFCPSPSECILVELNRAKNKFFEAILGG